MIRRVLLFVGLIVVSCALPSSDEFASGAASDGGVVDVPGAVDGGGDGSVTVLPDGAVVVGPDGSIGDPADANAPCTADYCQTFATSASLDEFNTESSFQGGGTIVVEEGRAHASIPAQANSTDVREAVVTRVVSENSRKAVIELDLQVDHGDYTGITGNVAVLSIDCIATAYSNIELYVGDTHSDVVPLRDDHTFASDPTAPNIPRSKVVHVRAEVDFDPVNGAYALSFDGKVVASRSNFAFGNPGTCRLRIQLGLQPPNPPTPVFDVRYDNLVVDLQ